MLSNKLISFIELGICMGVFSSYTSSQLQLFINFENYITAVIQMMGMNRKTSKQRPSIKTDLSDSRGMIVQLPKKSMMQICRVWRQNEGWQIADRF